MSKPKRPPSESKRKQGPKVEKRPAVQIIVPEEEREEFLTKLKELLKVTDLPFHASRPNISAAADVPSIAAKTEASAGGPLAFSLVQEGIPGNGGGRDS